MAQDEEKFYCFECEEYFYASRKEYDNDELVCPDCQRDENIVPASEFGWRGFRMTPKKPRKARSYRLDTPEEQIAALKELEERYARLLEKYQVKLEETEAKIRYYDDAVETISKLQKQLEDIPADDLDGMMALLKEAEGVEV